MTLSSLAAASGRMSSKGCPPLAPSLRASVSAILTASLLALTACGGGGSDLETGSDATSSTTAVVEVAPDGVTFELVSGTDERLQITISGLEIADFSTLSVGGNDILPALRDDIQRGVATVSVIDVDGQPGSRIETLRTADEMLAKVKASAIVSAGTTRGPIVSLTEEEDDEPEQGEVVDPQKMSLSADITPDQQAEAKKKKPKKRTLSCKKKSKAKACKKKKTESSQSTGGGGGGGSNTTKKACEVPLAWTHPLPGAPVTQGYGATIFNGKRHTGVDFGGGGNVVAPARGTIVIARRESDPLSHGLGNVLVVKHEVSCSRTVYSVLAHLKSDPTHLNGKDVNVGDVIGEAGESGFSDGIHLHYELKWGAVLGNAFPVGGAGVNSYFGYTLPGQEGNPDHFGYIDPATYHGSF